MDNSRQFGSGWKKSSIALLISNNVWWKKFGNKQKALVEFRKLSKFLITFAQSLKPVAI
jgi:CRISPR/Cas system CSM-associated protein Csm5 (group 7 of RAMP superfamily)